MRTLNKEESAEVNAMISYKAPIWVEKWASVTSILQTSQHIKLSIIHFLTAIPKDIYG